MINEKKTVLISAIVVFFSIAFLANCGEDNTINPEQTSAELDNATISCSTESLKDSSGIKIICGGDSIGVVLNGKNGLPGEQGIQGLPGQKGDPGEKGNDGKNGINGTNGSNGSNCIVQTLADNSGLKVLCDGDSVGVVLNGKNGLPGEQGNDGPKGNDGKSCTAVSLADNSGYKILCGTDSVGVLLNGKNGLQGEQGNDGSKGNDGKSCTAVNLADNSGYKIMCGTDSVGVVLNGKQGDKGDPGEKGASCTISQNEYTRIVTITCGDESVSIDFGEAASPETYEVSLEEITGIAQGEQLFASGSTIELYELNAETFKPTGKIYNSTISNDEGSFTFYNINLKSRYALFKAISSTVTLNALIDLKNKNHVNINQLTHLETERVIFLVKTGKTFAEAKQQAVTEILAAFYIDGNFGYAEDMNINGPSDADSALIALNKLISSNYGNTLAEDFKEDGDWDDEDYKWNLAKGLAPYWTGVTMMDQNINWIQRKISEERNKVNDYLNNFWSKAVGLNECTINRNNEVAGIAGLEMAGIFICKNEIWDAAKPSQKIAYDLEVDTYDEKCSSSSDIGKIINGKKNTNYRYYCSSNGWESIEYFSWNIPKDIRLNPDKNYETMIDTRDNKEYKTIVIGEQTWMAENLNYYNLTITPSLEKTSKCPGDNPDYCEVTGRLYTWAAAIDSAKLEANLESSIVCGYGKACNLPEKVQGICPNGWHLPSYNEWKALYDYTNGELMAQTGWSSFSEYRSSYPITYPHSDTFGFSAMPNKSNNSFWSSADNYYNSNYTYTIECYYGYDSDIENCEISSISKDLYTSIRCIKDDESSGD